MGNADQHSGARQKVTKGCLATKKQTAPLMENARIVGVSMPIRLDIDSFKLHY